MAVANIMAYYDMTDNNFGCKKFIVQSPGLNSKTFNGCNYLSDTIS